MADITITVPDEAALVAAFAAAYGYEEQLLVPILGHVVHVVDDENPTGFKEIRVDPEGEDTGHKQMVRNPESREDFARRQIAEYITAVTGEQVTVT